MASARLYLLLGAGGILLLYFIQTGSAGNPTNSSSQVLSSEDNDDDRSDSRSGSSGSGSSGGGSGDSGSSGSSGNGSGGSKDTKTETTTTGGALIRTEQKDEQVRTETRLPSGVRVKTRQEEGRTRVDIYQGATKLRLERRDDRTIVKLENKEGEQGELAPGKQEEVFKIEQRAGVGIKVRAAGDRFVVDQASASATTKFPLSVNLQTNELVVSTPAGERVVTVLPAQAVQNMLAANVIDQVRGLAFVQDVQTVATAPGTTLQEVITLTTTRDGVLVYEIPGVQNQRFLGFIPVQVPKTAVVSAETGQLVETTQSLFARLLDLASF